MKLHFKKNLLIILTQMFITSSVSATTFYVTNTNSGGAGSYNQAIIDSEADLTATALNPHIIEICTGGTITGPYQPRNWLIINAPEDMSLTFTGKINMGGGSNPLTNKHATFNNIVFANSSSSNTWTFGGAIMFDVFNAILYFNDCRFTNNYADAHGGAVFNNGRTIHFNGCTFDNNYTVNSGGMGGGAVHGNGGTTSFTNCTFSNNTSAATATSPNGAGGGALMNNGGTMTITNCTFYNNTSAMYGGAVHNRYSSSTCDINNSILVNNPADSTGDISGTIGSTIGNNIINSTSGATLTGTTTGNVIGSTAITVIDTILADNGAYRFTHNLISGSPAIDAAISAPAKDQRNFFRNGNPDIGALEYNGINPCSGFTATITQNKVGCFYDLSANVIGGTTNFSARWYDGATYYCQDSLYGMGIGTYYFTAIDDSGCVAKDSITISTLNVIVDTSISICFGDSILFKSNYIKTDSILSDTTSIGACDSIYRINLDVLPQITANVSLVSGSYNSINCYGDTAIFVATGGSSYLWDDLSTNDTLVYVYDTTFTVPFNVIVTDTNGCSDSTGITFAGVYPPVRDTSLTYNLCYGDTIVIAGTPYDSTATYMITTPSVNGCDSNIILNLTIDPAIDTSTTLNNLTISSNQTIGATYEWIDCITNTALVPAETGQSFTATSNGNYAVVVTVGFCSDTSACVAIMGVGINELNTSNISIYPNPTNNIFTIDLGQSTGLHNIKVYGVDGKLIYNKQMVKSLIRIDASNWDNGLYFVKIDNLIYKLVIE